MALTATDLFNDATTREIGGIGPDQVNLIVSDLEGVQQMLSAADPQINNLSDLHTHVIINQLNEEIATVENANSPTDTLILGTDLGQYVGRALNDIHRDIIDIAQGDPGVQALFNPTPLPDLNTPAAPFHDNATQTAFVTQWIQDSNHLGQMATTIENNGFQGDIAGLVAQIQTFETNSNAFDESQGGLWSARFWNELRSDGTAGTAASALIEGLQTQNAGEVNAAVEQLSANAADVASNNLMADGGSYASVVSAAEATAVAPIAATPPLTTPSDPATPPVTTPADPATPPSTTPPAGSPEAGGTTAGDGANHLISDLIAMLQGGGQGSASAVMAELAADVSNNKGIASLLGELHSAAAHSHTQADAQDNGHASNQANAQNAQASTAASAAAADIGTSAIGGAADIGAHHLADVSHHFHHMWG